MGGATIAVLAGTWFLLARWVWHTQVPGNLRLPELDQADYFTPKTLQHAADYGRVVDDLWLLSTAAGVLVLAGVALRARSLARRIGIGRVGTGIVLTALIATISAAASLPFALVSLWWDRRHGLSKVGYENLLGGTWGSVIADTLVLSFVVAVVMGFAAWLGRWWWAGAGPVFIALIAVLTVASPYLAPGSHPLRRPALVSDARELTKATGTEGTPFRVEDVHDQTSQANAFSIGLGPTRRVVLWDTLLRFPHREVRVVMAHELGHVARGHLWKGIVWFGLFTLPLLALLAALFRGDGLANPVKVPLALLAATVLTLLATPAENVVSRRYEGEADWVALRTTHDAAAARGLFSRFATTSLAEPNPSTWDYLMLENHPTIMQRIAMAKAWASRFRSP